MRAIGKAYEVSGIRYRNVPGQGVQAEIIYTGIPSAINQVRGGLDLNTYEFDHDAQSPRQELRVRQPPSFKGDPGSISLELNETINRVHKSIFEPPGPATVTDDELRTIRDAIQNPQPGQSPALTNPDAIDLYQLALRGVDSRIVYQPVFTVVRTAARKINWPNQTNGVGQIFTDSAMLADQGVTGLVNWTLGSVAYSGEVAPVDFTYGWLKHMPRHETVVGNRSSQVVEFEFGLWANILYSTV